MRIIVAGIHTGIGKTICSAVLCEALGYDYWKPVQAGELDFTDSDRIKELVSNVAVKVHPEQYRLKLAMSPHAAAAAEQITIRKDTFQLPNTHRNLLIETAGGILSPLDHGFLNVDLIKQINEPVILVCCNYLGSINHSLLSIAVLKQANISIKGIVFSGIENIDSESFITQESGIPILLRIPLFEPLNTEEIKRFSSGISKSVLKLLIH